MKVPANIRPFALFCAYIAMVLGCGLVLAGCSANVSLWAILLGYLLATSAALTITGCGDEEGEIITNPAPEDRDGDGYYGEWGGDDCNDFNIEVHPGADENCTDGIDNDCDELIDELDDDCPEIVTNLVPDEDGDGYAMDQDCNDNDENIHPDADENCEDGIDNDCDDDIDEADDECPEIITNPAPDFDGDGYTADIDCDDENEDVNPGASEECYDGIDNDCDDLVDDADEECPEVITNPVPDFDGDGYTGDIDCDDENEDVNPGASEDCYDGIDNDCDDLVDDADEECPEVITNPVPDFDGDGYTIDIDCDDDNADVNPGASEDCFDGIDNDCDELVDQADEECADIIVNPAPED